MAIPVRLELRSSEEQDWVGRLCASAAAARRCVPLERADGVAGLTHVPSLTVLVSILSPLPGTHVPALSEVKGSRATIVAPCGLVAGSRRLTASFHSHSIVPGGLLVMS